MYENQDKQHDTLEYVVTLYNHDDLDKFYHDMECTCDQLTSVPTRPCQLLMRRPMSRNTHYKLTSIEAAQLRTDPRVSDVQQTPEQLGMKIRSCNVNNTPYSLNDVTFSKGSFSSQHQQWGHLHCAGDDVARRKGQWGTDGSSMLADDSVDIFNDGKHVDVVIVDDLVSYDCEDWNSPSTGLNRFVSYQWYTELNQYISSIDDDNVSLPTGGHTYPQNINNTNDYHGTHVAGTVAGQFYGWAREANIYALQVLGGGPNSLLIFDYLRAFHRNKPINPITGKRNPTITNHSWGFYIDLEENFTNGWSISDFNYVIWDQVNYNVTNPNPSGWTMNGLLQDFGIKSTPQKIPGDYAALRADIDDAIDDGIVVIGAAGNDNHYHVPIGHPSWDNRVGINNGYYWWSRGSSPTNASKAISVGSLSRYSDFRRSTFTNFGPRIDVFAPGDFILSTYTAAGGYPDSKYTTGNRYNALYGTSMACPQVAGIAAIHASGKDRFTNDDVKRIINDTAVIDDMTFDVNGGGFSDSSSQHDSPNKYMLAANTRGLFGMITKQHGIRPDSGLSFPRPKIYKQAGEREKEHDELQITFTPADRAELKIAVDIYCADNAAGQAAYGHINTWDVSNVTNMYALFSNKTTFNSDIGNWDVSNVTSMADMFQNCTIFNAPLFFWDTSNVTTMESMFQFASNYNQPISSWDTSKVTTMYKMFYYATSFNRNINSWNTSNVTRMDSVFSNASTFNQPLNTWDTSKVTTMYSMFWNASAFDQDLSSWNIEKVTTFGNFLNGELSTSNYDALLNSFASQNIIYNGLYLSLGLSQYSTAGETARNTLINTYGWTITDGGCTDCSFTFTPTTKAELQTAVDAWIANEADATSTYGDINTWDVSNITDMNELFRDKSTFNSDISNWNTENVTSMMGMFRDADTFNQSLNSWDVSKVENMSMMFYRNSGFNGNVSDWTTSNVTTFGNMFDGASAFNQDLSAWDISGASTIDYMFHDAINFNSDISGWDTSNIQYFNGCFWGATAFNQNVSSWDISSLLGANAMFRGVTLSTTNYDALLNGWTTVSNTETQIPANITFEGGDSQYSTAGVTARNKLINDYNWTITDGGQLVVQYVRVGSLHTPAWGGYTGQYFTDVASWNDEDVWIFQRQMADEVIVFNNISYDNPTTENTIDRELINAYPYSNKALGYTGSGATMGIYVEEDGDGANAVIPGWPNRDWTVELKVGKQLRFSVRDPGLGGKVLESETRANVLDDTKFPNSDGDGWFFINTHNLPAGNNKVVKVDYNFIITQVINSADVWSSGHGVPN